MNIIKVGSKGDDVRKLQQLLGITVDGIFGEKTDQSVRTFQKNNGLVVDGIVGDNTWKKLGVVDDKCIDDCVIYKPLSVHITKSTNRPIKYLAIHFTAGSNSTGGRAQSVYNTFVSRSASADFCVDDRDIVQFNPDIDNYYCWSVGDNKYKYSSGGSLYGIATNKNTISIEMCSTCTPATTISVGTPNHSGWSFTDKVIENSVKLCKIIMKKYNIPVERVVRHYDISGKLCPGVIGWNDEPVYDKDGKQTKSVSNSDKWIEFKKRLTE